jgi:hypothetical protein
LFIPLKKVGFAEHSTEYEIFSRIHFALADGVEGVGDVFDVRGPLVRRPSDGDGVESGGTIEQPVTLEGNLVRISPPQKRQ